MENKEDKIELKCTFSEVIISVNGEDIVFLNENNNKIDTIKIFDKLNICENYYFELDVLNEPNNKKLEVIFIYTKKFLENFQKELKKIDYSLLSEE